MRTDELRKRFEDAGHLVSPRYDVTPEAAAWFLGSKIGTLRNWRSQSRGPAFICLPCGVRYPLAGLVEYLEQLVRNRVV